MPLEAGAEGDPLELGKVPFGPLDGPLHLLLCSLLLTLIVLALRSEATQLPPPRHRRSRRDRRVAPGRAAALQLWAGGLTLVGQLLAIGNKVVLQVGPALRWPALRCTCMLTPWVA